MRKDRVYVFIVRPPIVGIPAKENVILATGRNMDEAFDNVRVSMADSDFSARCVGAYTAGEISELIASKGGLHHHKAWSALEFIEQEYEMSDAEHRAFGRVKDRILATMLEEGPHGLAIAAK